MITKQKRTIMPMSILFHHPSQGAKSLLIRLRSKRRMLKLAMKLVNRSQKNHLAKAIRLLKQILTLKMTLTLRMTKTLSMNLKQLLKPKPRLRKNSKCASIQMTMKMMTKWRNKKQAV